MLLLDCHFGSQSDSKGWDLNFQWEDGFTTVYQREWGGFRWGPNYRSVGIDIRQVCCLSRADFRR